MNANLSSQFSQFFLTCLRHFLLSMSLFSSKSRSTKKNGITAIVKRTRIAPPKICQCVFSPALMKTTTDVRIVVATKLIQLWRTEIFGLIRVFSILLKLCSESSCSTTTLTVFTVVKVNGVIAGPITKGGTFIGRERNLGGLTKNAFQVTRMVA